MHTHMYGYTCKYIYIDIYVYIHTHVYMDISTPYNVSKIFIEIVIPIIFYCFIFTYRVKR